MPMRRRARRRDRAAMIAVIVAFGLTAILVANEAFNTLARNLRLSAYQDLVATLSLRREQIEATLAERRGDALVFVGRASVQAQLDPDASPDARAAAAIITEQTIADLKQYYHYDEVVLFDRSLREVAGTSSLPLLLVEARGVRTALDTGQLQLVDIHLDDRDRVTFGFAAPVVTRGKIRDGKPIGVAYLEIGAAGPTRSLINPWASSHKSLELSLLRRIGDNVEIMSLGGTREVPVWRFATLPVSQTHRAAIAAVDAASNNPIEAFDDRGIQVIVSAEPVAGSSWVLLAKIDRDEVDAPVRQLGWSIAGLVAALLFVLLLFVALILREGRNRHALEQAMLGQRYAAAISAMQDGFLRIDGSGRIVDANAAVTRMTGYGHDALLALSLGDLDAPGATGTLAEELVSHSGEQRFQTRWTHRDGRAIDIDGSGTFVQEGTAGHTYVIARDITVQLTEQRRLTRLNRLHGLVNHSYATIQRLHDPQEILLEICKDFVISRDIVLVWAGWVDREAGQIVPIAAAGNARDYILGLRLTLDPALPTSHSPSGRAVRERRLVVSQALKDDPTTSLWHAEVAHWGLGSSLSLPIVVHGQSVGVLAIYNDEIGYFDPDEVELFRVMGESISVAMEAAEGRRTAERLKQLHAVSEERLRRIVEASPVPMLIYSATSNEIRNVNRAFVSLFEYDPATATTVALWLDQACAVDKEREAFRRLREPNIARTRETGAPVRLPEVHLRGRDGSIRTILPHLSMVGDDELLAWTDITEERKRARGLAAEGEKHRILFESAADGIAVIGADARIIDANPAMLQLGRSTREQLIGTYTWQWNAAKDQDPKWRNTNARPRLGVRVQNRLRRQDGTEFEAELMWNQAEIDGTTVFYATVTDITDRLRAEQELRRTERLSVIGHLTGGIAHDFNNLLTVICLNLEIAVSDLDDGNPMKPMLSAALNAAYRGGDLNSQLLTFARRQSLRPVATDIDGFLAPLQAMATRAVGELYSVQYLRHGVLRPCLVDQAKLESAVLNLVINARDAMPDGGRILIETALVSIDAISSDSPTGAQPGDYVLIAVRDEGTGMTPEVRDRAFEPFFSTKGIGKGTGLGLSTVMGFVTQSGGFVAIDTEVGRGTAVKIYLPAEAAMLSAAAAGTGPVWNPGPLRTLLVEDQADVREAAIRLCQQIGLEVFAVDSADAALSILRGDPAIALLFTDVVMPGAMTGLELGEFALKLRPDLRVIYVSGHSEEGIRLDPAGRSEFLSKPYRREQLLTALQRIFAGLPARQIAIAASG